MRPYDVCARARKAGEHGVGEKHGLEPYYGPVEKYGGCGKQVGSCLTLIWLYVQGEGWWRGGM